jgi:hypothetical protein
MQAVQQYVELSDHKDINLHVKEHPNLGVVYSVDVPVKRVRERLLEIDEQGLDPEALEEWQTSGDLDPSTRFPYGC